MVLMAAVQLWAACDAPVVPTPGGISAIDASVAIGQMAVAFLNRFAASSISPQACLVDFTDSCRGKRDELSDIEFNRAHYVILGARLGQPTVAIRTGGQTADIGVPCAFDSLVIKCETADTSCKVGAFSSVAGTCILTSVREPGGWRLCTSNFASAPGPPPSSAASQFFGPGR
jgi:hypothetical protein